MNSFRAALKFFNKDALNANSISYRLSETNLGENSINKSRNSEASLQRNISKSREYGVLMKEIINRPRSTANSNVDIRLYSKIGYPWNSVCKEKDEEDEEEDIKNEKMCKQREEEREKSPECEDSREKADTIEKLECESRASAQNAAELRETAFKPHRFSPNDADDSKKDGLCEKRKRMADGLNRGISDKAPACNTTSHSTKTKSKKKRRSKRKCRCHKRSNPCGEPDSVNKTRRIVRKILSCEDTCKKNKKRGHKRKHSCEKKPRSNPCGTPKIGKGSAKSKETKPKKKPKMNVCGKEIIGERKKIPNKHLVGKVCDAKKRRRQKIKKKHRYPWGCSKTAQQVLHAKAKRSKKAKKRAKKKRLVKKSLKSCKTINVQCKYKRYKKYQRKTRAITSVYKKFTSCKDKGDAGKYPWDSTECMELLERRCKKRTMPPRRPSLKTLKLFAKLSKERLDRQERCARDSDMSEAKQYHSMTNGPTPIFLDDPIDSIVTRNSSSSESNDDQDYSCKPKDCNYLFCISGIECKVYPSTCKKLDCEDLDSRRDILCNLCHIFNTRGASSVSEYFGKSYQNKEYFLYTDASFYDVHGYMSRMRVPSELIYRVH